MRCRDVETSGRWDVENVDRRRVESVGQSRAESRCGGGRGLFLLAGVNAFEPSLQFAQLHSTGDAESRLLLLATEVGLPDGGGRRMFTVRTAHRGDLKRLL